MYEFAAQAHYYNDLFHLSLSLSTYIYIYILCFVLATEFAGLSAYGNEVLVRPLTIMRISNSTYTSNRLFLPRGCLSLSYSHRLPTSEPSTSVTFVAFCAHTRPDHMLDSCFFNTPRDQSSSTRRCPSC